MAMRHMIAVVPPSERAEAETEADLVHYEGCGQIGSHTLCGHTDQVSWDWKDTTQRVNCPGCVAVRNHVLGR